MWKKLFVGIVTLVAACGVIYAGNHAFLAASNAYTAGGNVTGRVNMAPNKIDPATGNPVAMSGNHFGMQKGDKVYIGVDNPDTTNGVKPLGWQLIYYDQGYTDYIDSAYINNTLVTSATATKGTPLNAWFAGSTASIGRAPIADQNASIQYTVVGNYKNFYMNMYDVYQLSLAQTNATLFDPLITINQSLQYNPIISERDLSDLRAEIDFFGSSDEAQTILCGNALKLVDLKGKTSFYLMGSSKFFPYGFMNITNILHEDLVFTKEYWTLYNYWQENKFYGTTIKEEGSILGVGTYTSSDSTNQLYKGPTNEARDLRPYVFLNLSNVVFGISSGNSPQIAKITEPHVSNTYRRLIDQGDIDMKLRLLDANLRADLFDIKNQNNASTSETMSGSTILLDADATGNHNGTAGTVSALVFDANDHFVYYQPLEDASGRKDYTFDTTGMAVGDYKIAIVNEIYVSSTTAPSYSSLISDAYPLKIVDPLTLSYTANQIDYEYFSDTASGNTIGDVAYIDGAGQKAFQVVSCDSSICTSNAHTSDYQNFALTQAPTSSPFDVTINASGPDIDATDSALKAGIYRFRILGADANNEPMSNGLPVDRNDQPVSGITGASGPITYGRLSDEIAVIVYPHEKQITYTQANKPGTTVYYTQTELNALTNETLGDINFSTDAAIAELLKEGYAIQSIQMVNPTSSAALSEFSVVQKTSTDPNVYEIKKNGTFSGNGNLPFSLVVTFEKDGVQTKQITKTGLTFIIPPNIHFYDPASAGSILTSRTYTYRYDTNPGNTINIMASDRNTINTNVTYCYLDQTTHQCRAGTNSDPFTVADNTANPGTAIITVRGPGTADQKGWIRAMLTDGSGNVLNEADLELTIQPKSQTVEWTGTGVTQKAGTSDTWTYSYLYDGTNGTINIDELLGSAIPSVGAVGIRSNAGTTPLFHISAHYANAADQSKVTINNTSPYQIQITDEPAGLITLEAYADGINDYGTSNTVKLELQIQKKPRIDFQYASGCSSSMSIGSKCTISSAGNNSLGTAAILPNSATGYTISIAKVEQQAVGTSSFVTVSPSPLSYNPATGEVTVVNNLALGTYRITFQATNGTNSLNDEVVSFTISNQAFNTANWKWQAGTHGSTLTDVGTGANAGLDAAMIGKSVYTRTYSGINGIFDVKLDGIPAGASVSYAIDSANTTATGVICKSGGANTPSFQTDHAGGTGSDIMIEATVSMTNYITIKAYLWVKVDPYTQTIGFANNNVLRVPNDGRCATISAADQTSAETNLNLTTNPILYAVTGTDLVITGNQVCSIASATPPTGNRILTATLAGDRDFSSATATKTIELYAPSGLSVTGSIDSLTVPNVTYLPDAVLKRASEGAGNVNGKGTALSGTDVAFVTGGSSYAASTSTGAANADASLFTVNNTGAIKLNQDITAALLDQHATKERYYIQVDVTDQHGNQTTVDIVIHFDLAIASFYFQDSSGAALPLNRNYLDGTTVPVYQSIYAPNGTLKVYTNMASSFQEDTSANTDQDVFDVSAATNGMTANLGILDIKNASDVNKRYGGMGGNAYLKACMNAGQGYEQQCIYAQIDISQATQSNFKFLNQPTWTIGKAPAVIQPTYVGKMTSGDVVLSSSDSTIAEVLPPVNGQDQEFKTMDVAGSVVLTAISPDDRNYKSQQAVTNLDVQAQAPTQLNLYVPGFTYGDTTKQAKITYGYQSGVPTYFYTSDPSILSVSTAPVSSDTSPDLTAHASGQVKVMVCQITTPFDPATDDCHASNGDYGEITVRVNQKPITLKYQDEAIYTGEAFPAYTFETPAPNSLAFADSLQDFPSGTQHIPLNTRAMDAGVGLNDTLQAGTYQIHGAYDASEAGNGVIKNYRVTITDGTLSIQQDPSSNTWYSLIGVDSGAVLSQQDWHKEQVRVVLESSNTMDSAGTYDQISDTLLFANTPKNEFLVTNEDENHEDVYFRIDPTSGVPHAGALSTLQQATIKIDQTDPVIVKATGTPSNTGTLESLLHTITLGQFFKPGVEVEITGEDPVPPSGGKASGLEKISYIVRKVDTQGTIDPSFTPLTGSDAVSAAGTIKFYITGVGNYQVCAKSTDLAGNESPQSCYYLNVKQIDVDVDGDGTPDFNDPDGDGCPDLNIKWKDPADVSKWITINGDRNMDGIPDLNIDADGDGKPELNVDTDGDGRPDVNLVILKKTDWSASICVVKDISKGIYEEYCTGTGVEPVINIDTDGDLIPELDIDDRGDFKPHLNISIENPSGSGRISHINIIKFHDWKPAKDYEKTPFLYDSIGFQQAGYKAVLNIDTNDDGLPDLNIDFDGDGIPDLNVDEDGDWIPDWNIDGNGDGLPDLNMDVDDTGKPTKNLIEITTWEPTLKGNREFPFATMPLTGKDHLRDQDIIVQYPDGGIFLPSFALKVTDVTKEQKEELTKQAGKLIDPAQEIKTVYDVKLLKDQAEVQPDGKLKIKIPVPEGIRNPKLMVQKSDGSLVMVDAILEDGCLIYETEKLGLVMIIGDEEQAVSKTEKPTSDQTKTDGSYTDMSNIGGAYTGDSTNRSLYVILLIPLLILLCALKKTHEEQRWNDNRF